VLASADIPPPERARVDAQTDRARARYQVAFGAHGDIDHLRARNRVAFGARSDINHVARWS
jgi:hypothetical protein